jgi:hypothetical protein
VFGFCIVFLVTVYCFHYCRFGNLGGFQILLERFQSGKNLTVSVIYALIRPFGLCYEFLSVHTIVKYLMPIVVSWFSLKWKDGLMLCTQESYLLTGRLS